VTSAPPIVGIPVPPAPLVRAVDAALEATVVLSFSRIGYAARSRMQHWRPVEELPGEGRTVVVTGANSGLGFATARAAATTGARVVVHARSQEKADDTVARLREEVDGADLGTATADLSDLDAVRSLATDLREREDRLDAVVHNAGAMFDERATTDDGLERTYQLHVVAPHLLTSLLLPTLADSAPSRVVTVTSGGMYAEKLDADRVDSPGGYKPTVAYARAKRAQVALTGEWQRRFGDRGIDFHVVHPGWALTPGVESSLPGFRRVVGPILRDPSEGADSITWLALADEARPGGRLWHDRTPRSEHKVPWTRADAAETTRLWARVCRDAGIEPEL
jgi:dehydrogenase/reductase SDR family member 12